MLIKKEPKNKMKNFSLMKEVMNARKSEKYQ